MHSLKVNRGFFSALLLTPFLVSSLALVSTARAEDPVRIFVGGVSSQQRLAPYMDDLKKIAGVEVDLKVQPSEMTLRGLVSGLGDIAITGQPEQSFARAEKSGMAKQNLADFMWYENPPVEIQVGVHPTNTVKDLEKAQITDILSGKTTNWSQIGGPNLPIKVFVAESYQSTMDSVFEHYLQKKSSPVVTLLKDKNGMLRGMEREPGAMGFFTQRVNSATFTPKYFTTDIKRRSFVIAKKSIRPVAKKVYDHIQTLKFDRD